jgi:glutamate N-acetyltransferase/amino-acid N-acetyltransferase
MTAKGAITAAKGFRCAATACGIKASRSLDLAVLLADNPCAAAAVFTTNTFCGAPVTVGKQHVRTGRLQAVVVNSGVANVATGPRGIADAKRMCKAVAGAGRIAPTSVLPASTGVIGQFLPMDKIEAGIEHVMANLSPSPAAGAKFARAIMTTDTRPKEALETLRIGRTKITIGGTAKGSGMIAPNMATMLAYITTDAAIPAPILRMALKAAVDQTFNRVTVDECPSTSDTVAVLAGGAAGNPTIRAGRSADAFAKALHAVCENLSLQIAADGEGATKTFEVHVTAARTPSAAHQVARAVASSLLVKTAIHGADPNWGRIVQAMGASGVKMDPQKVRIRIGGHVIFQAGRPAPAAILPPIQKHLRGKHVVIAIHLAAGQSSDRVLSCDLSRQYIAINADYHT